MNSKLLIIIGLTALAGLQGCSKYTDIKTAGSITPGDYSNFRELMNNTYQLGLSVDMPDITADDIVYKDTVIQKSLPLTTLNGYMWAASYYDIATADPDWRNVYASTYICNLTINDVMTSNGGTQSQKEEVRAEAKVHRAFNYYMLVNMYSKQYDNSTKATDLGVPLLLIPDVTASLKRATVDEVYKSIFSDLLSAIPALPKLNTYNTYPSKAGAYALLARVYLQTGQYALAGTYADSALAIQNTLVDLSSASQSGYPTEITDPEIILSKTAGSMHAFSSMLILTDELLGLYDQRDFRYSYFTQDYQWDATHTYRIFSKEKLNYENRNIGPSVPEVMLIRAEAFARAGNTQGAMDMINSLRTKRFATTDYVALSATSPADALLKVLDERRRELCCRCYRWFDQKRLNQETQFARSISRTNIATGETYTLAPNSVRYVYPIPAYNIQLSPVLEQNPR